MRPLCWSDLTIAARALKCAPLGGRWVKARKLVQQADAADRYRKKFQKNHPAWGNGTLMSAAHAQSLVDEPRLNDPDFQDCLFMVVSAVQRRVPGRGVASF